MVVVNLGTNDNAPTPFPNNTLWVAGMHFAHSHIHMNVHMQAHARTQAHAQYQYFYCCSFFLSFFVALVIW